MKNKTITVSEKNSNRLNKLKYDIFIPESKLLIEFHGFRWHSMKDARQRDKNKYINSKENNYEQITIFEDEWRDKKESVLKLIDNRLGLIKEITKLRPKQCEIKVSPSP